MDKRFFVRNYRAVMTTALVGLTIAGIAGCGGCGGGADAPKDDGKTAVKPAGATVALTGAGSTFVNPAMSKWAAAYHDKNANITINYQSVGSGTGIAHYKEGTVDFGATDAPLNDKDTASMPTPTINVPIISGAIVLAYNMPDVKGELKLSPDALAGIFMGKIKTWNDPKIAADNADLKLPATPITVCHRSDGSGTSFIFTDYLSHVNAEWKAGIGTNKSPNWPAGVGGKGNDGVAGLIKKTPGAIGYVELAYAVQSKLDFATLKNAAGKFVKASPESAQAAAAGFTAELTKDIRSSIVNSPSAEAYPITGFTYILVSTKPKDAEKSKAITDFLRWAMADGQAMAKDLQYAPLAKEVVDLNTKALDSIQTGAK